MFLFIFRLETHFRSGDILGINIDCPLLHWARNSLLFWGDSSHHCVITLTGLKPQGTLVIIEINGSMGTT